MRKISPIALLLFCLVFLSGAERTLAQADVVLAVDLSGTMEQNDPKHLRYYGADQFLTLLSIYGNNRNRAGVVTFGNGAQTLMELGYVSDDKAGKHQAVFKDLPIEDWTELGLGLDLGGRMLGEERSRGKSIIVISDFKIEGNPDTRRMDEQQARAAAERELRDTIIPELRRRGIKVYTIGLFSADTTGRPLMDLLARETGGFFEEVSETKQFYAIYKRMLDDIEPPAGTAKIKGENNRFALTPADYGVIITGHGDFSARSPNGTAYPTKEVDRTVVKQQFVRYPDGAAILFLGQPADSQQQAGDDWTGEWVVSMQGEGEATYLSNVRFSCDERLPPRHAYFRNEYMFMGCVLNVRADLDPRTKAFLEGCKTTYTVVRTDQSSGWSRSGELERKKFEYSGWALLDQPGEYQQEIQMSCGPNVYRTVRKRFSVYNAELLNLTVLYGPEQTPLQDKTLPEGETIRVVGSIDLSGATAPNPGYRGLREPKLTLELKYNSGTLQKIVITPSPDGKLVSEEIELEETGSLSIEGTLNGQLIVPRSDGVEETFYYPVRAKALKVVQIRRTWKAILESIVWWITAVILPGLPLFTIFRGKQSRDIRNMSLEGERGLSRPFSEVDLSPVEWLKRAFVLRGGPHVSVGGPGSDADVILPRGISSVIAEIGKDLFNNFYIVQKGDTPVYLRSPHNPLKPGIRERIAPQDKIIIEGNEIIFKPTFDPGD